MPYSGTIVPPRDLRLNGGIGAAGTTWGGTVAPVTIASVTDGTSNTALFSEHLIGPGWGPYSAAAVVRANAPNAKRCIFTGLDSSGINTGLVGARAFAQGCRAIPGTARADVLYSAYLGWNWLTAYPTHVSLLNYMHVDAAEQPPLREPGRHPVRRVRRPDRVRRPRRASTRAGSTSASATARSSSSRTRSTCRPGGRWAAAPRARSSAPTPIDHCRGMTERLRAPRGHPPPRGASAILVGDRLSHAITGALDCSVSPDRGPGRLRRGRSVVRHPEGISPRPHAAPAAGAPDHRRRT